MLRGVDLKRLTHRDLLDAALALLVEPLAGDPERLDEFLREHLYAPLPGTTEARVQAQTDALAQMGFTPEMVAAQLERQRQAAADADTSGS